MEFRSPVIRPVRRNVATSAPISKTANIDNFQAAQDADSDESQDTYFSEAENILPTEQEINNPQLASLPVCLDDDFSQLTFSSIQEQVSTKYPAEGQTVETQRIKKITGKRSSNAILKRLRQTSNKSNITVLESGDACVNNLPTKTVAEKTSSHEAILSLENKLLDLQKHVMSVGVLMTFDDILNAESTISQIDTKREYLDNGGSRSEKIRLAKIATQCCELKTHLRNELCKKFVAPSTASCPTQPVPVTSNPEPQKTQELPSLRALMDAKLVRPGTSNLSLKLPGMKRLVLGSLKQDASILGTDAKVHMTVEDWCSEYSTSGPVSRGVAYSCVRYNKKKHLSIVCKSFLPNMTFETELVGEEIQCEGNRSPPKKRGRPFKKHPISYLLGQGTSGPNVQPEAVNTSFEIEQSLTTPSTPTLHLHCQEAGVPLLVPPTSIQNQANISNFTSQNVEEEIVNNEPIEMDVCPTATSSEKAVNDIWEIAREQQDKILEIWKKELESARQRHEAKDTITQTQVQPPCM